MSVPERHPRQILVTESRHALHPYRDKVYKQDTGMGTARWPPALRTREEAGGHQAAACIVGAPGGFDTLIFQHPCVGPSPLCWSLPQPHPVSLWSYTQVAPSPAWGQPLTWNPLPRSLRYGLRQPATLGKLSTSVPWLPIL